MSDGHEIVDYGQRGLVFVLPTSGALAERAVIAFTSAANEAVLGRGAAYFALSGGSTPKAMGQLLASDKYLRTIPWRGIDFFWSDERWVPVESEESNAGVALRTSLERAPVPKEKIHSYDTTADDPQIAAAEMEAKIRYLLPEDEFPPRFDLIFLGMGDDGHTASLFPGTSAIQEDKKLVVAHHVPKLNADRLTFTPPLINAARQVVFLVSGSVKSHMLKNVLEGDYEPDLYPAQIVRPVNGRLIWLVDADAAADLYRNPDATNG
jgi:6-phosphogluconolactonase